MDHLEQQLIEARDALTEYWEQPEGQACVLALRVAADALADFAEVDRVAARRQDADAWRRIETLVDEIARLRAPLQGEM